ncbi:scarecrow-like protein 3 [Durio zibethinus]|uniref:Scarecrow-like protein 3 n=1 Tax=Durio zibethinus TaxID=66656 RepID=A0A6P5Z2I8_DURZI|nr:scarecrow-like protein 3 [Durio zibethinus]XP_022746832.1 scarecrow-like protein 3 [Durio zibethinus]
MIQEGTSSVTSSPHQFFTWMSLSPGLGSPFPWPRELKSEERGLYLIHLLVACANHVAAGSLENANIYLEQISQLASPDGDTMQRIAAYFTEALADRMLKAWPGLHKALNSTKISSVSEEFLVQKLFFELCPILKLAYIITNQAIVEAMEGEKMVHIIDLYSFEPAQWINLFQTFSSRPEGPPHLRITGIHKQKEVLKQMALRLTEEAEKLNIPFQFNPIVCRLENLDLESLRVKTGEALAVSSVLELHSLLATDDEMLRRNINSPSVSKNVNSNQSHRVLQMNQRTFGEWLQKEPVHMYSPSSDLATPSPSSPLSLAPAPKLWSFLTALRALSPKLMVVTEQESNHNGPTLMERAMEALNFYAALFDCLQSTVSRAPQERQKVEKMLFGEEIKNIIACEGLERKVRHEKLEKWILRLELASFLRVPLSYHGMLQAGRLLQTNNYDGYKIKEENGCLLLFWQERPLYSMSAWGFRRYD